MADREPIYALYPGPILSRTDGQTHMIGRNDLARLYGVPLSLCVTVTEADLRRPDRREFVERAASLTALRPRYSGNYTLPDRLTSNDVGNQKGGAL